MSYSHYKFVINLNNGVAAEYQSTKSLFSSTRLIFNSTHYLFLHIGNYCYELANILNRVATNISKLSKSTQS